MADKNNGTPLRWENDGTILIGSSGHNVLFVEKGSVEVEEGGYENFPIMDRGVFTGDVIAGDERPSRLNFSVKVTSATFTTASDLYQLLKQTIAGGKITTFPVALEFPDTKGASTGQKATFNNCFIDGSLPISAGQASGMDMLRFSLMSLDAQPTWADY